MATYIVDQDVFDSLPPEAQDAIKQNATEVTDPDQEAQIQQIAGTDNQDQGDQQDQGSMFDRAKADMMKNGLK